MADDDDDLDEMLDEVERKFCSNACATTSVCGDVSAVGRYGKDSKQCRVSDVEQPVRSVSADIDALLEELSEEDASQPKTKLYRERTEADKRFSSQSGGRKCCPVFIGGTSVRQGVGTALSQRSCDQLRCISCDFRVLMFDDSEWDSSCDYLFLRNNMPDRQKLMSKLKRSTGCRSYACQCSWTSILEAADLQNHPDLRWVCSKHQD